MFIEDDAIQQSAAQAAEAQFLVQARNAVSDELADTPGARLYDLWREGGADQTTLTAVIGTPFAIEPDRVADMEEAVTAATGQPLRLVARSVITHDADAQQFIYERQATLGDGRPNEDVQHRMALESGLSSLLDMTVPDAHLTDLSVNEQLGKRIVPATVRTRQIIRPGEVARIEKDLREFAGPNVHLTIRSVVGADAAPSGYVESPLGAKAN